MRDVKGPAGPWDIILMGASLNTGNRGVWALAVSVLKIVDRVRPSARIGLFLGGTSRGRSEVRVPGRTIGYDVIPYRLSWRGRLAENLFVLLGLAALMRLVPAGGLRRHILARNRTLAALAGAKVVADIRGGDSFSDIYGFGRLLFGSLPDLLVILLGQRLVLLPQTYGPFASAPSRAVARAVLGRASSYMSRDQESLEQVRILLGGAAGDRGSFCPDVAFVLDPVEAVRWEAEPPFPGGQPPDGFIGINVNGLLYNGGYTQKNMFGLAFDYRSFATALVRSVLERTDRPAVLVPHVYGTPASLNNDLTACRRIADAIGGTGRGRLFVLGAEYDQSELKALIGRSAFFVGSRMHSCIAALSQGVPTAAVAYSRKFLGVFESVGLGGSVLDARATGQDQVIAAILERWEAVRDGRFGATVPGREIQQAVYEAFDRALPPMTP